MKITVSEALGTLKLLAKRHNELVTLRDQNSASTTQYYGANADKMRVTEPKYDVKALDKLVTQVAREQRLLEQAIKRSNATIVLDYEWDDVVLGEV
jgi:hypothetical protein